MKVLDENLIFHQLSPTKFSGYIVLLIPILVFCYQQLSLPLVRISSDFSTASLPNTTSALMLLILRLHGAGPGGTDPPLIMLLQ